MNKIFYILLMLPFLLVSCDENTDVTSLGIITSKQEKSSGMKITKTSFNKDSTKMYVYVDRTLEAGEYDYEDHKQVNIKVKEYDTDMTPISYLAQPTFQNITNVGVSELKRSGLVVNVLIDLTQSVSVLNEQRDYVYKMSKDLCKDNLYLTFMYAFGKRSMPILATPYVIENYISRGQLEFEQNDSIGMPYIYRTVSSVVSEMETSYKEPWMNAKHMALIVFSDGIVYDSDSNLPLDPQHFQMQLRLVHQARQIPADLTVSYVNLTPEIDDPSIVDVNMMKMLCSKSRGQFYDSFSWETIKNDILSSFDIRYPDYLVTLQNPTEKIYSGNKRHLKLSFYNTNDSLLAQAVTSYQIGSVYNPVCIGPYTIKYVLMKGLAYGGLLLVLIYVIVQFIVPYVMYRLFRKKYIVRYQGKGMVVNTIKVPKTCYYCKAPFKIGEKIVAKCEHVMHEDCWNENDYHCPEHGVHCPDGSHYYNQHNLFDRKNASFYMRWVILSALAGMVAWLIFISTEHDVLYRLLENILCRIFNIDNPNDLRSIPLNLNVMTSKMYMLPGAGVRLGFMLTLVLSSLTSHHTIWYKRIVVILVRCFLAAFEILISFVFEDFIIILGQLHEYAYFLDWIPWTMTALIIANLSTYKTCVRPVHKHMFIVAAGGCVSTLFWEVFGNIDTINEELLLILCFVILAVSIAVSIAKDLPPHEHYFLHVNGEIKETDIAIYKWLRQSPDSKAYIGRSVDCHLQITWDILSEISPVHAAIVSNHGVPQLMTVDGDVYLNGKLIKEDKQYTLYHGDSFQIGTTSFKFIEM